MKIQQQLNGLVQALLLPAALAVGLLIVHSLRQQGEAIEAGTLATARALTQAVDQELASARTALQALATSPSLAAGDLAGFDRQARSLLSELPGSNVTLTDASGQQLINTLQPFGQPLPRHSDPATVQLVFRKGQPTISDLYLGPVSRQPVIGIDVPVRAHGQVVYDLSMGYFASRLSEALKRQNLPDGWVAAILDSQGTVVARTHESERYVGKKATPELMQAMKLHTEGRLETDTLEGIPVVSVFSRSGVSNWSVAIGIPRATFQRQLWTSIAWLLAGTIALLVAGFVLARWFSERIAGTIRALAEPAAALGRGEVVRVPRLKFDEAEALGRALVGASRMLRDREDILAVVCHDLRNPLSMIMLNLKVAERMARRVPDAASLCAPLESMAESGRRMAGLVDDLLAVAVATHGQKSMLDLGPVSPRSLLQRSSESVAAAVAREDLRIEVQAEGMLPDVRADADRILRVFVNLLDNALKFTPRPGRIVLRACAQGDVVRFSVANSGPPLPDESLSRMFMPFWQAGEDRRGAGLGLSICRSIIETHGGRIWAEAEAGMSVTVSFELPMARAVAAAQAAAD